MGLHKFMMESMLFIVNPGEYTQKDFESDRDVFLSKGFVGVLSKNDIHREIVGYNLIDHTVSIKNKDIVTLLDEIMNTLKKKFSNSFECLSVESILLDIVSAILISKRNHDKQEQKKLGRLCGPSSIFLTSKLDRQISHIEILDILTNLANDIKIENNNNMPAVLNLFLNLRIRHTIPNELCSYNRGIAGEKKLNCIVLFELSFECICESMGKESNFLDAISDPIEMSKILLNYKYSGLNKRDGFFNIQNGSQFVTTKKQKASWMNIVEEDVLLKGMYKDKNLYTIYNLKKDFGMNLFGKLLTPMF